MPGPEEFQQEEFQRDLNKTASNDRAVPTIRENQIFGYETNSRQNLFE